MPMKQILTYTLSVLLLAVLYRTADAQTVTTNPEAWSTLVPSGTCNACTITVPTGFTLQLSSAGTCTGCTFTGGGTVTESAAFNFAGTTAVNNLTIIFNTTPGTLKDINFTNDSIAVNAALTYNSGPTEITDSRIYVGAALKFSTADFNGDSIHLNSSITFNNSTDTIQNSNVDMANASSISAENALFKNSVFATTGIANITTLDLTSSNDAYFMNIGSKLENNGTATYTDDTIALRGTSSFINTSGATFVGGTVSTYNTSLFSESSSLTSTGTDFSFNDNSGATVSANVSMTGGSLTLNSGASFTAHSSATFSGENVMLNGTSSLTVSATLSMTNGSDLTVGNGPSSTAKVKSSGLNVTGNSFVGIDAGSNSITVSSGGYTNDHGWQSLSPNSLTGCGTISNGGSQTCVVLAVASITLSTTNAGDGKVALSWKDIDTTAADHYLIQRDPNNSDWSTITTIPASAGSNGTYSFTDDEAPAGTIYYRIVRVDGEGNMLYSSISAIDITSATTGAAVSIYPNPVVGGTFYVTTPYMGQMIVNVFTMTGQLLLRSELNGQTQYAVRLPSQAQLAGTVVVQTIAQGVTRSFTALVR